MSPSHFETSFWIVGESWRRWRNLTQTCQNLSSVNQKTCSVSTGGMCPFRHISGEKTVVCKHWLRGLCKKGDQCEFLHEYDMTKMPECYFYSKFGV